MSATSAAAVASTTPRPAPPVLSLVPPEQPYQAPRTGAFRPLPRAKVTPGLELHEQQTAWIVAAQRGDHAAAAALLESIDRFIWKRVWEAIEKARHGGLSLNLDSAEDMWSAARVAVLQYGIDKFEAERGWRPLTYLSWWVQHGIDRWIHDYGRTIRVPVHLLETKRMVNGARRRLSILLQRNPTTEEIGEHLGISPRRVAVALSVKGTPDSLDRPVFADSDDSPTLGDVLSDRLASPEDESLDAETAAMLRAAVAHLPERLRTVMELRYFADKNLRDVSAYISKYKYVGPGRTRVVMGISRERVRQLEVRALELLRSRLGRSLAE